MPTVTFRIHGELNAFLLPLLRGAEFVRPVGHTDTLKHIVESLGIPHTEVGSIVVNGITSETALVAGEGDVIDVHPHSPPVRLAGARFVADGHLGRLAAYLRMLGFDTLYDRVADDIQLARTACATGRVLLTRDVGLLKRKEVQQGCFVHADNPHTQLREVVTRYGLSDRLRPFTRCMACNGTLDRVDKERVAAELPPHTLETKDEFSRCGTCGKVYWKGSHHARMRTWIDALTSVPAPRVPDRESRGPE